MASPLAEAHITAQARLRALVGSGVANAWAALPGYDEKDVPAFLAAVLPLVAAGQRHAVGLTDAFIARALGRQPLGVSPDALIGAAARNGTAPSDVYRRPFVTVWAALKGGTLWRDAVQYGQERAVSAAAMDMQLAMRDTLQAVGEADHSITGYQRVADGGACDFCLEVDGAYLRDSDAMPLHNHCGCGVDVVTDSFTPTPEPDTVAIHDHGELGPLLGAPGDHFTTESEL